jgi:hypothetical protein
MRRGLLTFGFLASVPRRYLSIAEGYADKPGSVAQVQLK